jgi:hypothetical protein
MSTKIIETRYANAGRPLPPCASCDGEIDPAKDREVVAKRLNGPHSQGTSYRHIKCARRVGII